MPGAACSTASLTSTVASPSSEDSAETRRPRPRALLVSIHDVAPALANQVRTLWDLCQARGVTPALLVVPNWHGQSPLERAPAFVDWVQRCAGAGAELFLHGERHDELGLPRTRRDHWRAWGRTAREGEFLTLDASSAGERIARGLTLFERLGLRAVGFVPPAWLARPACWDVVGAAGLRFSEDSAVIRVHEHGRFHSIPSPVVRWSGRTTWRARGSASVAAIRWQTQRGAACVRLALHPGDLDHPRTTR